MKNKIQEIIKNIKTFFYYVVSGQFKKKEIYKMIEPLHDFMITWEIPIKFIVTLIPTFLLFWFAFHNYSDRIFNKYSFNNSETVITTSLTDFGKNKIFTGAIMDFIIINETDSLTILTKEPKIFIKVYYNYSKSFRCNVYEVTKYVDLLTPKMYPLRITKRLDREYYQYKLRVDFFDWLKTIDNSEITSCKIYLTFYNDVNKKTKMSEPYILNKEIYQSKTNKNLNLDKSFDIMKKLGDIK